MPCEQPTRVHRYLAQSPTHLSNPTHHEQLISLWSGFHGYDVHPPRSPACARQVWMHHHSKARESTDAGRVSAMEIPQQQRNWPCNCQRTTARVRISAFDALAHPWLMSGTPLPVVPHYPLPTSYGSTARVVGLTILSSCTLYSGTYPTYLA